MSWRNVVLVGLLSSCTSPVSVSTSVSISTLDAGPSSTDAGASAIDAGVDGGARSAYAAACDDIVTTYCERLLGCGALDSAVTLETCVGHYAPYSCTSEASVEVGFRAFDAAAMRACGEALNRWDSCAELADVRESCLALAPRQGAGAPCLESNDCADDLVCAGQGCERTCRETSELEGEPCSRFNMCREGQCDGAAGRVCVMKRAGEPCYAHYQCDGLCVNDVCVTAPGPGEPCGVGVQCKSSAFCNGTSGRCEDRKRAGAACTDYTECTHADCRNGVCFEPRTGAPCVEARDCPNNTCDAVLHVCTSPRVVSEGEACTGSMLRCGKGQTCSARTGRCEATQTGSACATSNDCPVHEGCLAGQCQPTNAARCGTRLDCLADSYCHVGECRPRVPLGASCLMSVACATEGAQCLFSVCTLPRELDAPCTQTVECKVGLACAGGRCVRAGLLGQPCTVIGCFEGRCDSPRVLDGTCRADQASANGEFCAGPPDCQSAFCELGLCVASPMACMP
jgi:hypothetical protein